MIAYKKTNGRASDLRCVKDSYVPAEGEFTLPGCELPDIETLHDPAYVQQRDADKAAREAREASFDAGISNDQTLQAFRNMTREEFNAWWDANVTNAQQAIGVLKRLCWVILRHIHRM
jgi:hypothetical protein